jgi:hypothetical protein
MHVISINGSNAQKSKLRNGHKVRVKHGSGFNVIVNPSTYHIISRAFLKNKGVTMQLSPEELAMNRAPSPELQAQIMGSHQPLAIPSVRDHLGGRGLGTGVGDWFKNLGNTIKSGFENTIQKPVEQGFKDLGNTIKTGFNEKIANPAKEALTSQKAKDLGYLALHSTWVGNPLIIAKRMSKGEKFKDIINDMTNTVKNDAFYKDHIKQVEPYVRTAAAISNPMLAGTAYAARVAAGEKPMDVLRSLKDDLMTINNDKNRLIKSNPVTREMYKKGVPALTGLAAGTAATALGANPITGALVGAAGSSAGDQLVKAEGYGIHHFIDAGLHKIKKHMKHLNPIGGSITLKDVKEFMKNAGKRVKDYAHATIAPHIPVAKEKMNAIHQFIVSHPELGSKVKEFGAKLAGILAREGVKYMTGSEDLGKAAEDVGKAGAKAALDNYTPYGKEIEQSPKPESNIPISKKSFSYYANKTQGGNGLYAGRQQGRGYGQTPNSNLGRLGGGLYGGDVRHFGIMQPPSRLVGGGFNSFDTLHQATIDNAKANHMLGTLQNMIVQNQHLADPIKKYWDEVNAPPSRGTGFHKNHHGKVHHRRKAGYEKHNHYNLVRGKGTLLEHKSELPPALQSQPYGANFHMQNMLPPQYQKYNDGTNEY